MDDCEEGAGSDPQPVFVRPPADLITPTVEPSLSSFDIEPEPQASIQHVSKVRPENIVNHEERNPDPNPSAVPVYVPEFHFYNEQTGEPLDEETIQKMHLEQEIQQLQSQFFQKQLVPPAPKPISQPLQQLPNFSTDEQFLNFFQVNTNGT